MFSNIKLPVPNPCPIDVLAEANSNDDVMRMIAASIGFLFCENVLKHIKPPLNLYDHVKGMK